MSRDLPQGLYFIRGQIGLASRRPSQLPRTSRTRNRDSGVRMVNEVSSDILDTIHPDDFSGLRLELWPLQYRDFTRVSHTGVYTALRYRRFRVLKSSAIATKKLNGQR